MNPVLVDLLLAAGVALGAILATWVLVRWECWHGRHTVDPATARLRTQPFGVTYRHGIEAKCSHCGRRFVKWLP